MFEGALPAAGVFSARYLGTTALLIVLYYGSARWGLWLAFGVNNCTAIWPPAGLALAALLLRGIRMWPGIVLGVVLTSFSYGNPSWIIVGSVGVGCALSAVIGALMLQRLQFDLAIERHRDVLSLITVAVLISLLSASCAVIGGVVAGALPRDHVVTALWRWSLSDLLGTLLVAPLVLTWVGPAPQHLCRRTRLIGFPVYLVTLLVASKLILATARDSGVAHYVGPSMVFPLLIWAALQFGQREVVLSGVITSVVAIWGALHAPLALPLGAPNQLLLTTDVFIGGVIVTALLLGAVLAERRRAEDRFRALLEHTPDPLLVMNGERRVTMVNKRLEECLGYQRTQLLGRHVDTLFPTGLCQLPAMWNRRGGTADPESLKIEQWLRRHNGAWFQAEVTLSPLSTREGLLVMAAIRDVTDRHEAQQHLRRTNDELERRVAERTVELARRNKEKEILLKEIHHRIKNNLQIICSLMNLQARGFEDPRLARVFADSQYRVQSMALVHEHLYRSHDLNRISMRSYIHALTTGVACAQAAEERIRIDIDASEITLPIDTAVPCGLIINELVTNAFKHAFPDGRCGRLSISLRDCGEGQLELMVSDDGVGFAAGADELPRRSFGMKLVSMLADQLRARFEILPGAGSSFRLAFVAQDALQERPQGADAPW
jgi:two-component system, sensor histidine kinase PdtaS